MHTRTLHDALGTPLCIMDVLSDAQWRTNTPGLIRPGTLMRQQAQLICSRKWERRMQRSSAAPPPLPPPPRPRLCRPPPLHLRRDPRVHPRKVGLGLGVFTHTTWRRPRFCTVWEQRQQIWPEFTQLLLRPTTEGRTYARMDAAGARPRLFSPLSLRLPPAPGKDTGAPSSAAVSSGHLPPRGSRYQARFGRSPPLSPSPV